jgi:hypothetical protein
VFALLVVTIIGFALRMPLEVCEQCLDDLLEEQNA